MKVKPKRMLVLVVASLAMLIASSSSASAASTCLPIVGSGSSLQKVAQQEVWITGFTKASGGWWEGLCETDPSPITYNATSSGTGKGEWGYETATLGSDSPFDAFIGTDLAPSAAQIEHMGLAGGQPTPAEGTVTVPVAQSAVSVVVSLPLGCKPKETTEPAEINSEQLQLEWEKGSSSFASYVKGVTGTCTATPELIARSSKSGTTAGFKRYFATLTLNAAWLGVTSTPLKSEEVAWPMEVELSGHLNTTCCEKGSTLASLVFSMPGTSGYADLADARNEGFAEKEKWVEHTNAAGEKYWSAIAKIDTSSPLDKYEAPEEAGGGSNCSNVKYKEQGVHLVAPGEDWSEVKPENVTENGAYPICTLTFDLAWNSYETTALNSKYGSSLVSEHYGLTVLDYLKTVVASTQGQSSVLTAKHYGALPAGIRERAEAGVNGTNIKA
jgi:hypothetical protein